IENTGDFFEITALSVERICAKYIINCAGGYSDRIAALIGDDSFKIIPRAGEYMLLDKAEGTRVSHTIFQVPSEEGKGILVSPTADGNLLTGPTASEVKTPGNTETTVSGLDAVRLLSLKSVPSIDFRQVITSFSGVRASESRGDFIISSSANSERFINVAAIDSPGLTCCVSIARYVINILNNTSLSLEKKEVWNGLRKDTHYFEKMSDGEKDEYIKSNPDFGKIICRCEKISEGEIREAIRTNPPARDVDGIKRRTRSGMGRCQGGFCLPNVMRILADEMNLSIEDITKSGKNSHYIIGKI
ncbi:MAG: FAD-dependent oxidoreductase, partial [Oscillospiraceae bacterium]|nr:FAD-dependent oxidoreductase [Oscillospiraceae bacterium]